MSVVSDSHYQSTVDDVYVYVVPWSEFCIVPSYPHYLHAALRLYAGSFFFFMTLKPRVE